MAKPVTTQATGKIWKLIQLIGFGLVLWGVVGCMMINDKMPEPESVQAKTKGALLGVGGVIVFLFGRAGGWWFHG